MTFSKWNNMKNLCSILGLVLIFTSCSYNNIMYDRYKRFHWEVDMYDNKDNSAILYQAICKCDDNPRKVCDGRSCRTLTFLFIDSIAAKEKRYLDLKLDTNIVRCNFESDYSFGITPDKYFGKPEGHIKIILWTKNKVILREKLSVFDYTKNEPLNYFGFRTYKRDRY